MSQDDDMVVRHVRALIAKSDSGMQTRQDMVDIGTELYNILRYAKIPIGYPELRKEALAIAEVNLRYAVLCGELEGTTLTRLILIYHQQSVVRQSIQHFDDGMFQLRQLLYVMKTGQVEGYRGVERNPQIITQAEFCCTVIMAYSSPGPISASMKLKAAQRFGECLPPEHGLKFGMFFERGTLAQHDINLNSSSSIVLPNWQSMSGGGKFTEIVTRRGVVYGHVTDQRMSGPLELYVNGVLVKIISFRVVVIPRSLDERPGEEVHLTFSLSNLDGTQARDGNNKFIRLEITYNCHGKLTGLCLPCPPNLLSNYDDPAILVWYGKIYTIPVSSGHYKEIVEIIYENRGKINVGPRPYTRHNVQEVPTTIATVQGIVSEQQPRSKVAISQCTLM